MDPLEEQQAFLTTELPFQPPFSFAFLFIVPDCLGGYKLSMKKLKILLWTVFISIVVGSPVGGGSFVL